MKLSQTIAVAETAPLFFFGTRRVGGRYHFWSNRSITMPECHGMQIITNFWFWPLPPNGWVLGRVRKKMGFSKIHLSPKSPVRFGYHHLVKHARLQNNSRHQIHVRPKSQNDDKYRFENTNDQKTKQLDSCFS